MCKQPGKGTRAIWSTGEGTCTADGLVLCGGAAGEEAGATGRGRWLACAGGHVHQGAGVRR